MSSQRAPERLDALVPQVLRQTAQRHSALFAIQRRWKQLVGRTLAEHTKPVSLRRGRLTVYVDRPGDGFTLSYQSTQLLERLRKTGTERVEEIVLRPGVIE